MDFLYRTNELGILKSTYQQIDSSARMIVLTGRRRIGKTTLALEHASDKPYLYLFISKKSEKILCDELIKQIQEVFPDVPIYGEIQKFADVFKLLLDISKTQPYVLIIDEFQEFMTINPSVYSDLQMLWDLAKSTAKLQVLFLGSVFSLMHRIFESYEEPLFGREDRIINLQHL
jgi:hypothetical protein